MTLMSVPPSWTIYGKCITTLPKKWEDFQTEEGTGWWKKGQCYFNEQQAWWCLPSRQAPTRPDQPDHKAILTCSTDVVDAITKNAKSYREDAPKLQWTKGCSPSFSLRLELRYLFFKTSQNPVNGFFLYVASQSVARLATTMVVGSHTVPFARIKKPMVVDSHTVPFAR